MSAPDELAADALRRYVMLLGTGDTTVYLCADADRVIATFRRLNSEAIAARDARIAELSLEIAGHHFVRNERDRLDKALASRDAEIARLREALESIKRYGLDTMSGPMETPPDLAVWYRDGVREMVHRARAALTPPSQDVGGENALTGEPRLDHLQGVRSWEPHRG
jgi:hypothetical protein